jgi:ribosome modulation factor
MPVELKHLGGVKRREDGPPVLGESCGKIHVVRVSPSELPGRFGVEAEKPSNDEVEQAVAAGAKARQSGGGLGSCPYRALGQRVLYDAWATGFKTADTLAAIELPK